AALGEPFGRTSAEAARRASYQHGESLEASHSVPPWLPSAALFDDFDRQTRQELHGRSIGTSLLRVGGIAVEGALVDALADRCETKEGEGQVVGPVVDAGDPAPPAIGLDIGLLRGNAERRAVESAQPPKTGIVRQAPLHALVG